MSSAPGARDRFAGALPVFVAAVLYAASSHGRSIAMLLGAVAAASLLRGPWLRLSGVIGTAVTGGVASLAAIFAPQPWIHATRAESVSELSARAAAGLIMFAAIRLHIVRPAGGTELTFAALIFAAVACGQAPGSFRYPLLAALLLASMATSVLLVDRAPRIRHLGKKRRRSLLVGTIVGAAVATTIALTLPLLHAQVIRALYSLERRGFHSDVSDEILLGGAADITLSDELVLRVHGPRPDHLRGVVFNRYLNGRWVPGEADPGKPVLLPNQPATGAVRVEAVRPGPRYFVPLHATQIAAPSGLAVVDRMGAYRAPTGATADTIWFLDEGPPRAVRSPMSDDLGIPAAWSGELRELAERWAGGAGDDAARLTAIESTMQRDFRYSLKHTRRTNADPIVDFLLVNRVGHCEYFASGMALLARSLGIPARVVSGFRVSERNPVGDFHVVRGRDAHAWVEAWVDGRWETYDPTPASALAEMGSGTTPWAVAIWEWAGDRWNQVDGTHARLGLFGSSAVFAGGAAFVLWIRKRRQDPTASAKAKAGGPNVAGMDDLFSTLAARGLAREASETLESYALRLRQSDPSLSVAADIIERYARFRYGGIGTEKALESALASWTASTRRP